MTDAVALALSADQALVLFELLARRGEPGGALTIAHEGETRVLDAIEAELESVLTEPFDPDYLALLDAARTRVAG